MPSLFKAVPYASSTGIRLLEGTIVEPCHVDVHGWALLRGTITGRVLIESGYDLTATRSLRRERGAVRGHARAPRNATLKMIRSAERVQ